MADSKLKLILLFATLILVKIKAETQLEDDNSSLITELDRLNSKISFLESSIEERAHELKSKDEGGKRLEKLIQEKSATIASLQNEIDSLQEKGSLDAKEQLGKAYTRAGELEKQVNKLKEDIQTQDQKKEALESQANVSEKRIQELNLKLEKLEKINNEQKTRIRKTERALQAAEEELIKAKSEATSMSKQLTGVHRAWLPPWLAVHLKHCQSFMVTRWSEHGRPVLDITYRKALEKKVQVEKWVKPHFKAIHAKWIPAVKEQLLTFTAHVKPHVQMLTTKCTKVYHASKTSVMPHVVKVQEITKPYIQEAKKYSKPYIDQVVTVTKPHVNKARVTLKPYTKKVVRGYKKFVKVASGYHRQVQTGIHEILKSNGLTEPLATKELVWFAASAVLALPVFILSKMFTAIFSKKAKRRTRSSHTNHARRRAKRVHPDK